jgi:ABC-type glycerol-3-phosphate transport system permease component
MLVGGGDGAARTLPLALADLAIAAQYRGDQGMLFAGLVIVTLPMLAIYVMLQGHLVRGIAAGAVKG